MAMIEVEGLTRSYGPTLAVADLAFQIEAGQVVGLLGKNGAGKTTTMRMLSGTLSPSGGSARVAGFDLEKEPKKAKALIGYLPEVPPLYTDMTARGFLTFAAHLRGVKAVKQAVENTIERVGLGANAARPIHKLSKGYRQRVGIAQAIVHSPKVLLLDEPLSGLDPAQRREIRDLIADLAHGDTTVVLSTHVLPEIEVLCDRVVVLNHGRLVANDRTRDLGGGLRRVRIQVARPDPRVRAALAALEHVQTVEQDGESGYLIVATEDVREQVSAAAVQAGLLELTGHQSLEEAFLRLTDAPEETS
ncbi:MAG: ABC transporter ATP-binding protein [Myxococcota bacterium]